MLRRFLAKSPTKGVLVEQIYNKYAAKSYVGSYQPSTDLSQLVPAPLPGDNGRAAWKAAETPAGAVGLLLQHTHLLGGVIDMRTHTIYAHNRLKLNYMDMPSNF